MTQHTDFSTRLDDLQQRVAAAKSAVQAAAAESEAQLSLNPPRSCQLILESGC